MVRYPRFTLSSFVLALLVLHSLGAPVAFGQKKPKPTLIPTDATLAALVDGLPCGVCDDGLRPYLDGIDLKARRTSDPRTLTYNLNAPLDGQQRGLIAVNDTHGQTYDLSNMTVGQVKSVRASYHFFVNGVEYVLRFGQTENDGSDLLHAERLSTDEYRVRTNGQRDVAPLLQGNGPGAILLGTYHVPLDVRFGQSVALKAQPECLPGAGSMGQGVSEPVRASSWRSRTLRTHP
jgi:hypothetical protein